VEGIGRVLAEVAHLSRGCRALLTLEDEIRAGKRSGGVERKGRGQDAKAALILHRLRKEAGERGPSHRNDPDGSPAKGEKVWREVNRQK